MTEMMTTEKGLARPATVTVAAGADPVRAQQVIGAAQTFYAFWNTGDAAFLVRAIDERFTDHTLPPGRPQGPEGPAVAARAFRAAVPDLTCEVLEFLVVDDRITARLRFTGTFSGSFGGTAGAGQAIDFIAFDVLRVTDGKVTDNWHLEDNLTFLTQAGIVHLAG